MRRAILISAAILAGCATSGVQVGSEQTAAFKQGITTEADVVQKLGRPNNVLTSSDGGKTLTYSYANVQIRPSTFIPIVGLFAGGSDVRSSATSFVFDKSGKLVSHNTVSNEYGTSTGLTSGAPMASTDQPR